MNPGLSFPVLPDPLRLSEAEEHHLGLLAAWSIRDYLQGLPEPEDTEIASRSGPQGKAGVFVTLFHEEELRGCLGAAEGKQPLSVSVPRLARAAASKDVRFDPIREHELPALEVEITVLGELTLLPGNREALLQGLKPEIHGVH